ncbi:MAG: hypothetical protein CMH28_00030 [Micavibrio sp.]|nr:hypothetical protein [Micavibrio sp.]|tara:strand:- start:94 stop:1335 length:1242 start_codon:yes stop_codon:yes gene_type:complete
MLSVLHPEILYHLQDFNYGLMPIYLPEENKYILVIKATKEGILTVSTNNAFKVYLIKSTSKAASHLGLVTAFFDDHDEPLTITTPLFSNDEMLKDITNLFTQEKFEVYFFDENNYELLGAKIHNEHFNRFSKEINTATLPEFQQNSTLDVWKSMERQFGLRTVDDDCNAYEMKLEDRLYPDDVMIMDIRENFSGFNDSQNNIALTSLDRDGDPGPMQEKDIARLFRRLFEKNEIFLNPFRADDAKKEKRELVDILIVTEHVMLFVQAKDSPNTVDMLQRSIERKRKTIRGHIKKATDQVRGALCYARDNDGITISINDKPVTIKRDGRQLVGLIVVKELFDDDYPECSAPVLKLVRELDLPINLLDYPQLHVLTQNFTTQAGFINGLFDALDMALDHEQFPKSVFSKKINTSS